MLQTCTFYTDEDIYETCICVEAAAVNTELVLLLISDCVKLLNLFKLLCLWVLSPITFSYFFLVRAKLFFLLLFFFTISHNSLCFGTYIEIKVHLSAKLKLKVLLCWKCFIWFFLFIYFFNYLIHIKGCKFMLFFF